MKSRRRTAVSALLRAGGRERDRNGRRVAQTTPAPTGLQDPRSTHSDTGPGKTKDEGEAGLRAGIPQSHPDGVPRRQIKGRWTREVFDLPAAG